MEITQVLRKGDTIRLTSYGGHPVKHVHLQEIPKIDRAPIYELGTLPLKQWGGLRR